MADTEMLFIKKYSLQTDSLTPKTNKQVESLKSTDERQADLQTRPFFLLTIKEKAWQRPSFLYKMKFPDEFLSAKGAVVQVDGGE